MNRGNADKPPRKRRAGVVVLCLFAVVLYLLSVGPASLLWHHGYISTPVFEFIYAPIRWMCRYEPIRWLFSWYTDLWLAP